MPTIPNKFQKQIAKRVNLLVMDERNRQRFHQMIVEFQRLEDHHRQAVQAVDKESVDSIQAILTHERLRDKAAGPPGKGWQWWRDVYTGDPAALNGYTLERDRYVEGWFPPSTIIIPANPWPWDDLGNPERPFEQVLAAEYLLLALCHDYHLPEQPPIITTDMVKDADLNLFDTAETHTSKGSGVDFYYCCKLTAFVAERKLRHADDIIEIAYNHVKYDVEHYVSTKRPSGQAVHSRKPRKKRVVKDKPLTEKQAHAVELYYDHGSIATVARMMSVDYKTAQKHIESAQKKMGADAARRLNAMLKGHNAKTQALPTGSHGDVLLAKGQKRTGKPSDAYRVKG